LRRPRSLESAALLLTLTLPRINDHMTTASIEAIHADVGAALAPGAKLLDLTVDLSAIAPQDCPPVSHYRLVLRDRVWLRRMALARGDEVDVGALVAEFTTTPDEPLDVEPARAVRVTVAGILAQPEWWQRDRP
jgi:hypothetical protein